MNPPEPNEQQPEPEQEIVEEEIVEQEAGLEQEQPLSDNDSQFAVVGIGASAGGLNALQRLLENVPADSGLAWVVVTHLSPNHESYLAALLQNHTTMPVQQVNEELEIAPNWVYVIPPNRNLSSIDSHLRLVTLEESRQARAPIDHFFRTLAESHGANAIGVVLSGTGSDGAIGLARIKEMGGLPVVQDPAEAEFDSMPRSAIAIGQVDMILPVSQIPVQIVSYLRRSTQLPSEQEVEQAPDRLRTGLQQILTLVRMHTGHDFNRYRIGTIMRRIQHRMQLLGLTEIEHYLDRLRTDLGEVQSLGNDFLISVTNFFRDRAAFELLEEEIIPALYQEKGRDNHLRVWVVGCATGEEAYSLGMLLLEYGGKLDHPPQIQIFASDLSEVALRRARDGIYPETISQDVSPERLARFFILEQEGFRVRKELRDIVLFAPHNLLKDPPFSKVELISCRNVLIYLEREIQGQVLELFHYALLSHGALFLGASEVIDGSRLFETISRKQSLYRRRDLAGHDMPLPSLPLTTPALPFGLTRPPHVTVPQVVSAPRSISYGAALGRILERYGPPSLLVTSDYNIIYFSQGVNQYLDTPPGEATHQVLPRVRKELRSELTAALFRAFASSEPSLSTPVDISIDGKPRQVLLGVWPASAGDAPEGEEKVVLVLFHERDVRDATEPAQSRRAEETIVGLEEQLTSLHRRLQTTTEEYETSKEEMQATNEELQSMNEELRATAEELETSKEEMQSINEELMTVNQENKHRVEEMTQLTSDLQNLLASTDIATLFLDRQLRITRFTPRAGELFNVLASDRGRPLAHLTHKLGYAHLLDDAAQVLRTLVPIQREIESESQQWYLTRLVPYRSLDDRIEGVVITLVDITNQKGNELALRKSQERYQHISESGLMAIAFANSDGLLIEANTTFLDLTGYSHSEVEAGELQWEQLTPPEWLARTKEAMEELRIIGRVAPYEKEYLHKDGSRFWGLTAGAKLTGTEEWVTFVFDISDRKQAEESLRANDE